MENRQILEKQGNKMAGISVPGGIFLPTGAFFPLGTPFGT
jgi:hypothetical protein